MGLRWPFGGDDAGPQTYTSDEYGFTVTYDGSLSELPIDLGEEGMEEVYDFDVGFFDADGPAVDDDYAADGIMIAVLEIGDPIPQGDPRLEHLGDFALASLKAMGNTDVGEVTDAQIEGCTAAVEVESTDVWGRHSVDRIGVAGGRMYLLTAAATSDTPGRGVARVDGGAGFGRRHGHQFGGTTKAYSHPDGAFSLTCDRRFIFTPVSEQVSGLEQPLGLSDPLSGTDADGLLVDGMVVAVQDLAVTLTAAQRKSYAKEVAGSLDGDGWRRLSGPEPMKIDGLPAYRFEAVLPDGSSDALYAVFSGTLVYYVEGYAAKTTWKAVEPLFDEAARTFDVR